MVVDEQRLRKGFEAMNKRVQAMRNIQGLYDAIDDLVGSEKNVGFKVLYVGDMKRVVVSDSPITEDNNEVGEGFLLQATYTVLHDDGTILTWHHCKDVARNTYEYDNQ